MIYGSEKEMTARYEYIVQLMMEQYHKIYEGAAISPEFREKVRSNSFYLINGLDFDLIRKFGNMYSTTFAYDHGTNQVTFYGLRLMRVAEQEEPRLVGPVELFMHEVSELSAHIGAMMFQGLGRQECEE